MDVIKKTLKHYVDLELYANGVADDIEELLYELYKKCNAAILANEYIKTKKDYKAVHSVIDKYFSQFQEELFDRLKNEAERVKENEREFLEVLYGTTLTVGAVALSKVLFTPFVGNETVESFVSTTVNNISKAFDNSLRSGYLFSQSSSDVQETIAPRLRKITSSVKNEVRTAIPSFAKTTDKIVFINNNKGVVWVATLDGRTCIECASLSGMRFRSVTEAPSFPHLGCRCVLILASEVKEPVYSFEEFIENLDEDEQKEVLGANRYKLWKTYNTPLNKFLNDGRVISWEELSKHINKENKE